METSFFTGAFFTDEDPKRFSVGVFLGGALGFTGTLLTAVFFFPRADPKTERLGDFFVDGLAGVNFLD